MRTFEQKSTSKSKSAPHFRYSIVIRAGLGILLFSLNTCKIAPSVYLQTKHNMHDIPKNILILMYQTRLSNRLISHLNLIVENTYI